MMFEEKLKYFQDWQAKIKIVHSAAKERGAKLDFEFQERKDAIQKEFEGKDQDIWREFNTEAEKYKAELKAIWGITDGEKINVLETVEFVRKVLTMP